MRKRLLPVACCLVRDMRPSPGNLRMNDSGGLGEQSITGVTSGSVHAGLLGCDVLSFTG